MVFVDFKSLMDKLNGTCHHGLAAAAECCRARTHYRVEIEHWLLKLSEMPNTDLHAILQDCGYDFSQWTKNLTKQLDQFKTGNTRPPVLSTHVVNLVRSAWLVSSVDFGCQVIRSGHLLVALLSDESLSAAVPDVIDALAKISPIALRKELPIITADTCEAVEGIGNRE